MRPQLQKMRMQLAIMKVSKSLYHRSRRPQKQDKSLKRSILVAQMAMKKKPKLRTISKLVTKRHLMLQRQRETCVVKRKIKERRRVKKQL